MSPDKNTSPTKLCPTCGTRVGADAARCLVCGTDLSGPPEQNSRPPKAVQGSRMPELTISLPAVIGVMALFAIILSVMGYLMFTRATAPVEGVATLSPTPLQSETPTLTPTPFTPTPTSTPEPSPTPLGYTIKLGDTCLSIAYAFNVSVQSIVLLNNLPADCSTLYENQKLLIPQPTPTATALPTTTLSPAEATEAACQKFDYTVQENDTLSSISLNYNVPAEAIKEYNGLVNDIVRFGQVIKVPLCRRNSTPGPSPTPTLPPPYPPVPLLLPPDGAPFSMVDNVITLQWASVGALRPGESYAVTIEDITEGEGRKEVAYVNDTKYILPDTFLPGDRVPHVIRWWVIPVRQVGTDEDGNPVWEPSGAVSAPRVFTWSSGSSVITPTP